ncbi:MAG: hypothetical protein JWO89_38, partial [Verrucomicrobiaceae bacterium]|nr:hypothetical protein [Verrucomicrobiaceae bacterium]
KGYTPTALGKIDPSVVVLCAEDLTRRA